ncbi:MAG: family 78 glycoside hydrolase catalytic domain [Lentisphaeria bacterium]|nr:family 78 glycoside hydrolase catalytic domain [Lentisphaeria bacterium]
MDIYHGKWINIPLEDKGRANYYRKTFELNEVPECAELFFCAAGYYEIFINGTAPDDRVLAPAISLYDRTLPYTVYKIAHLLKKGRNTIVVHLANGWYNIWEKDRFGFDRMAYRDDPKFMTYLECDGRTILKSDDSWKVCPSGITYNSVRHGEFFDANQEPEWIFDADADDSCCKNAQYCFPPGGNIVPEVGHPCRVKEYIEPVNKTVFPFGRLIYDFGVGIAGWCEFTLTAPPGTTIYVEYGEMVKDNGDLDCEYIRNLDRNAFVFQEDRFTVGKSGRLDRVHAHFTWYGFRYIRVRAESPEIKIEKIRACVVRNDFEKIGSYKSSNDVLDALLPMTCRSYESNFVGIPTDCPHREKNGYTGDVQLACSTGLFLYDAKEDYKHYMQCVADTQRVNGHMPFIAPGAWGYYGGGPAWDMVLFVLPYEIYRFTGDSECIEKYYPNMLRYLDFCKQMERDDLVYFGLGDWCPVEYFDMCPSDLTTNGCYYDVLKKAEFFAKMLGKNKDAADFAATAAKVRTAFNEKYYKGDGIYGNDSWTALGCPLYFGLVEESEKDKVLQRLLAKIRANAHKVDFGILGAKYIPHVLAKYGYSGDVIKLFTQTEYPGWGHWVKIGAKNLWETWSGLWSRNHIMYGDVANWCFEHLGGLRFEDGELKLDPKFPLELDNFECSHKVCGRGEIKVAWNRENDGTVKYSVTLTDGLECTFNGRTLSAGSEIFIIR